MLSCERGLTWRISLSKSTLQRLSGFGPLHRPTMHIKPKLMQRSINPRLKTNTNKTPRTFALLMLIDWDHYLNKSPSVSLFLSIPLLVNLPWTRAALIFLRISRSGTCLETETNKWGLLATCKAERCWGKISYTSRPCDSCYGSPGLSVVFCF